MPDDDLLRLARQSAETDLPFLLRAKEEAKKRMKDNPTPENVGGFRRAREELEGELARRQGQTSIRVYKTQLDAVAYLSGWMPGAARGSLWSTKKTTARMRTRRVRRMREDPVL